MARSGRDVGADGRLATSENACCACGRSDSVAAIEKNGFRYRVCANCDHAVLSPIPSNSDSAALYSGGYFEGEKAVGASLAGRIGSHVYVSASGAYGIEFQQYAARGGIALAW